MDAKGIEAVPVEITRVKKSNIEIFLVNNCTLEPEKQVDVVAKTSGIVNNIVVEEGDYVKTEETLAELDPEELLLALSEAEIKKDNTERIYKRSLDNFKDNIISKEDFEDKKFQYESALIEFEKEQLEFKYATIKSPIDGVVINRNIEVGYNLEKNQVAFKIADFDPILAKIYVPEKELNKIEEGQSAKIISESSPEIEFMGNVKMISPVVDPESGTIKVTLEVLGLTAGVLMPGMFVSVYTIVDQHQDALVIPKNALILEAEADEVFVVKDFIVINTDPAKLEELDIDNTVVCKQKGYVEKGLSNGDDYAVHGKVIDFSSDYDSKRPLTVTVEVNDIINKNATNIFDTVSFYDNRNTLISQINDVVFGVETKAFKTKITLGFKEGNNVEVLTGLKEGDRVITVGQDDVGHGASVEIVNEN